MKEGKSNGLVIRVITYFNLAMCVGLIVPLLIAAGSDDRLGFRAHLSRTLTEGDLAGGVVRSITSLGLVFCLAFSGIGVVLCLGGREKRGTLLFLILNALVGSLVLGIGVCALA